MKSSAAAAIIAISSAAFLTACGSPPQQSAAPVYPASQSGYAVSYGYVDSIQVIAANNSNSPGVGAVVGGVVGGILGNQVGGGTGKTVATVAGVVGGAVLGNQIEQKNRAAAHDQFQISVRLDNGSFQTIQQDNMTDLQVGSRVRVDNGRVYRN